MLVHTAFENDPRLYEGPDAVITAHSLNDLPAAFARMERALDGGLHLAGFLSYEAGYAFEERLRLPAAPRFPLVRMGCYRAPQRRRLASAGPFRLGPVSPAQGYGAYAAAIGRIREHIAAGDVYQITYCTKVRFPCAGDTRSLFAALLRAQPVPYAAYIETEDWRIASLSPELFLRRRGRHMRAMPMKGTWPRGAGFLDDLRARFRLQRDPKNRAENVMIADLMRNDLGRVGDRVRVPRLFEVSGYASLFQMTSTVEARLRPSVSLWDIFAALFPSGSVTGAPKVRAMGIIRELEPEERHIYTGAIGWIAPDRSFTFNVPIRTLLVRGGMGEMGIGGGIVWDSTPQGEWEETRLKARFLTAAAGGDIPPAV